MECEIKLTSADGERLARAFCDALSTYGNASAPETHAMHSVYYDLPDYSLRERGISLRFRTDNGAGCITVKTKAANDCGVKTRDEWEVPCNSVSEGLGLLPAGCVPLILSCGRPPNLREVAEVDFTRVCFTARTGGASVEFSLDRGYFNGDPQKAFAELEAELKGGSVEELKSIASALAEKYALSVENSSKLARALALRRIDIDIDLHTSEENLK